MKTVNFLILLFHLSWSCFSLELDFNHQLPNIIKGIEYQGAGGLGLIELQSGKRLWLTSETFLDPNEPFRSQNQLVHNSIFIEDKVNNQWESLWRYQKLKKDRVLFSPPIELQEKAKRKWYWLNTGWQLPNNEVIIFARMVESAGSFDQISKGDYLITHNVIIKITNSDKPVEEWQVETSIFPLILGKYVVSTSLIQNKNVLYLYFITANSNNPNAILAKVKLQALSQLDKQNMFSFWSEQQWIGSSELVAPEVVIEKTQPEQAIFWHENEHLFYHFWHEKDNTGSQYLKSATSTKLQGPWSEDKQYPIHSLLIKGEVFFGVRYHPIQTSSGILTYSTNHINFYALAKKPFAEKTFWPKAIYIQ